MGGSPVITELKANMLTSLARLAVDSGGRFTESTNDLTLGYARAERDQGCVYTLGFYLEDVEEDRLRGLSVRMRRDGLRAMHASQYVFRSAGARRQSLLRAAWVAPEMFDSGVVRAHVFPLRPVDHRTWSGLLAIRFPIPLGSVPAGASAVRDFGAALSQGSRIAHRFQRRVRLAPEGSGVTSTPLVTFLEPVELRPGTYELTSVMVDPGGGTPHSVRVAVEVPEIPLRELFVVPPVLGRQAGPNLVVLGDSAGTGTADRIASEQGFEPLMVQQLDEPADLVALTQACLVDRKHKPSEPRGVRVERALLDSGTSPLGGLVGLDVVLDGPGPVRCQNLVDLLPGRALGEGEHVFEAWLADTRDPSSPRERVRFFVGSPGSGQVTTPPAVPQPLPPGSSSR